MSGSQTASPGNWITQTINGMQYDVLLPANYSPSIKYPTVLYLHALDMGTDPGDLVPEVNAWFNTPAFRTDHPSIIVMPLLDQTADPSGQTINFGGVSTEDNAGETNAIAALKQVQAQYSADPSRIYVTGNSLGGIGTEDMIIKYNAYTGTEGKIFAAGLSLAGADYGQGFPQPNASVVSALKNVPFMAIHGGQDTQVPLAWDQNLYAAEQAIGGDMIFNQDNSLAHDVWDTYYPQDGAGSPLGWLFNQSATGSVAQPVTTPPVTTPPVTTPPVTTPPVTTPAPASSPDDTVVLAGSTDAITDAGGNLWTITSGGQVAVNGTADATTANVTELAYVSGMIWQENASKLWWGETNPNDAWAPADGTATSPLPAATTPPVVTPPVVTPPVVTPPVVTPPVTPGTPPGTRDPSQVPFASTSVFNLPLGSGAQWQANGQLQSANVFINTADGSGYNENIYTGTASDPLVTVTNTAGAGGTAGTFQVRIPAGATPAPGSDATLSVDDTTTHTWYGFGGFQWTGATTATVSQGSGEPDYDSGITVANSNWDEGVGTLRQSDLQAGTIDHMLRMELPTDMLASYSQSSTTTLAPYAWPQTAEDGFAINGNGGPTYSGTVPFGVTIGIPASAVEPAAVAANAGADMLWKELQDHGAMVRDSGGSGNTVIFQADQNVSQNDPLIQGMDQYGGQIMAATEILANQGPDSVNGGGTPIVPLAPAPNDMPSATGSVAAPAASVAAAASPASTPVTVADNQANVTISQSQASVVATGGDHMLFISGTGDSVDLTGGNDTITDTGSANLYVIPPAGQGYDTFTGSAAANLLTNGDTLDLRPALAATDWNGAASTLANYLTVADTAQGAVLSIAPTSAGLGVAVAAIGGATTATLQDVLAHALT